MPTTHEQPPKSNARRAAERICRGLQTGHRIEVPGLAEDIVDAVTQEHASALKAIKEAMGLAEAMARVFPRNQREHSALVATTVIPMLDKLTAAIAGMEGEAA